MERVISASDLESTNGLIFDTTCDCDNLKGMNEAGRSQFVFNGQTYTFNNNASDVDMFDEALLRAVDSSPLIPPLPDDLHIRPLRITDYHNGYLELLSQLTSVGDVSEELFKRRFRSMQKTNPKGYYVVVIEEESTGRIIASGTLVVEWKFIHGAGCRGRTEDVVVDKRMRGRKLGKIINYYLVEMARIVGVYKMSLECKDKLITFYEQFGFTKDVGNNFMVQRFESS